MPLVFGITFSCISIHAPRTGSDLRCARILCNPSGISIHAPRTGSDQNIRRCGAAIKFISIHAPRTGSDAAFHAQRIAAHLFQSTLPARGATRHVRACPRRPRHFNPRSPHGERPSRRSCRMRPRDFNPRSPHGERHATVDDRHEVPAISIHAPRTGSDGCVSRARTRLDLFQSTLPARGATRRIPAPTRRRYFNPRSPHGERLVKRQPQPDLLVFQSTLPARGATAVFLSVRLPSHISIHAPRTGSDDGSQIKGLIYLIFQSTLPARGATRPE